MSDDMLKKLYHLSANPFTQRSNPSAPLAGRALERRAWEDVIDSRTGQRGSSLNFIVGDYGLGKTHSLFQIQRYCEKKVDVACVFLKLMLEDPVKNFAFDIIRRIFKYLPDDTRARIAKARNVVVRKEHLPHLNVITRYAAGTSPHYELLIGAEPPPAELRRANIRRVPKTAEAMLEYLTVLLVLLHAVGIRTLVLLVDEAEYIFSQLSDKKSALVFNALRAMYDLPDDPNHGHGYATANIVFFFAISTSGHAQLHRLEKTESRQGGPIQPLLSRLNKTISLGFLSKSETKDFLEEYLRMDRVTGKKTTDPLIPYDDSFVEFLYEVTEGHPRRIVERCDYVLEEGLKDRTPVLTKKYAKQVLERLNVI